MNEKFKWFVKIYEKEYIIDDASTRDQAKFHAAKKYKEETGGTERTAVLALLASCVQLTGRRREDIVI